MLKSLLADRFKLVVHNEAKDAPAYALMVAREDSRLGPKLKSVTMDCVALRTGQGDVLPSNSAKALCSIRSGPGLMISGGATMPQLATSLSRFAGRTVFDRTGLTGLFELEVTWVAERQGQAVAPIGAPSIPPVDPNGPTSLFTAVREQLGLKLEPIKLPVDTLIIDEIERPTED
jgi:uncharacterized protein (TIGR03435 family)